MDTASFLYAIAGSMDVTADDLEQIRRWVDEARVVVDGSHAWSLLGESGSRLDVHINALRSLAERARRASEALTPTPPPAKGPIR